MDAIKRPTSTEKYWSSNGEWKCACNTSTHKRGQRFTQPQCQYCVRIEDES